MQSGILLKHNMYFSHAPAWSQDMFDWEKNELDGVSVASQSGGAGDSRVGSRRGQRGYENVKSKLMAMTLELEV